MTGQLIILLVRCYQVTVGPFWSGHCRFQPTCSHYMIEAVRKYGALLGLWRGIRRLCRCHPWGGLGADPP